MSPEMCFNKSYNSKTDVYTVGIIFIHLFQFMVGSCSDMLNGKLFKKQEDAIFDYVNNYKKWKNPLLDECIELREMIKRMVQVSY